MYKVTKNDLIGDLEGFPIEVVQKMLEEQVRQGYKANLTMFQEGRDDGFSWLDSPEGVDFWGRIIYEKNFDLFFKKYPRVDTHVYYRGVPDRGDEIIAELKKLGGVNRFGYDGSSENRLYFSSPITRVIGFCMDGNAYSELLKDTYTEKFLPEKTEFIEIDGKKYKKEDVINRIKELKEEK